jgi:HPr kinase/phosphorylase
MTLHGSLLDVQGVGTLLLGPSGIGKSECALELLSRGHRLVGDALLEIHTASDGRLVGAAPERIRHFMEIRGVGIVSVLDLFGVDAVRDEMSIDLICRLVKWREGVEYERVGLDRPTEEIGGVQVPSLTLPARPGGSMATVVEVAVREHCRRCEGVVAARRLDERLRREMSGRE